MILCPVCGNDNDPTDSACRFCGSNLNSADDRPLLPPVLHRTINLELGRPVVENALKRLHQELAMARAAGVRVVTLIHGYGSSGRGGRIRTECRKSLDHLVQLQQLNQYIPGESFNRRFGAGKALLRRYPQLEKSCGPDYNNPGITMVVL